MRRSPKDITIRDTTLDVILENHKHWLNEDCEGWKHMRADLHCADLSDADLRCADLRNANLYGANLNDADLRCANLCHTSLESADLSFAYLYGAIMYSADLRYADLSHADLYSVNLRCADLRYANLCDVNLQSAYLHEADLRHAKNIPYIPLACPSDGTFIGWKECEGYLIKLEIPEDAKRLSATTRKCRCDKAKVLGIYNIDGSDAEVDFVEKEYYAYIKYSVGEMVYPDGFDEDRWNECSHGIHFFINKQDAINY